MAGSRLKFKIGVTFAARCVAFGTVMALANVVPYFVNARCLQEPTGSLDGRFGVTSFGGIGGFMH